MSFINWSNRKIINENTSQYIEEARGKKIADPLRAKLMGMQDIRSLKGTMTPRYFATKVIRYLQKENPELDIENLSDEDIQQAINIVSNVSKPLATRGDIKITTRERGTAESELKKGDTGYETLFLNLGDDAVLSHEGDVGSNDLYTALKDGLKYRVTLKDFKGTKLNLNDLSKDEIVSVVVVKPSEMEKVDKFGGEIEMGQREKLVADYPEGEEDEDDYADIPFNVQELNPDNDYAPAEAPADDQMDDFEGLDDEDGEDEDAEINVKKSDLNNDGKLSEYERKRGQAIADAMENEDDSEDEENNKNSLGDLIKSFRDLLDAGRNDQAMQLLMQIRYKDPETFEKLLKDFNTEEESSCDEEEDNEEIALSPQQINQAMIERGRQEMHRHHRVERFNRYGF